MTRSTLVLCGSLVAVLGFAAGWHLVLARRNADLRAEIARLEAEIAAATMTNAAQPSLPVNTGDIATADSSRAERTRLESEIESLEDEVLALAALVEEAPSRRVDTSNADLPPVVVDRGTPHRTVASFLQALQAADAASLEKLITMDDAARAEADRFYRDLPDEARAAYPSSDSLIAAVLAARSPATLKAVGDAETLSQTTSEAHLRIPLQSGSRKPVAVSLGFRMGADGWRLLVPATVITGYRYSILEMPGPR